MFIDLLRHGEVDGPACFRGSTDTPLSENGFSQMQAALENHPADLIISSPLQRCEKFAHQWANKNNIKCHIEGQFQEINFGDWDGKTAEQINQIDPNLLTNYWQQPELNTPPNGESIQQFKNRVSAAWQQLLMTKDHEHLLLVTHGGVIKAIIADVLSIPVDKLLAIETPLASMTRIRISKDKNKYYCSLVSHGISKT